MVVSRYRRASSVRPPVRPELGTFVSGARDDFWADAWSKQLTPARLGAILREAEDGDISRQCEVFDKLEEDPPLSAVYAKRKRAAMTKELLIEPADETPAAEEAAELCKEVIGGIRGWREALYHLLDAIGRGFSVCQTVWVRRNGRIEIDALEWWKQREFMLDTQSGEV
ncbi:MAG TPA: hypothetical protein DC061_02665, partial [Gemmobacter sp.]|nr:hypothetical protein [Gemmobacter sp.]